MNEETPPAQAGQEFAEPLAALIAAPERFSFDAAMALFERVTGRPAAEVVRFRTMPGLATPWSDVLAVRALADGTYEVTVGFGGLTGHDGVLPRPYSALVDEQHRARSPALAAFLDMLAQRPRAQFAEAGRKYTTRGAATASGRPAARPDDSQPLARTLFALMGLDDVHAIRRSGIDARHLLYFSGLIATRPRSAERLRTLLEEWVSAPVRIEQFTGQWVPVPVDQQSCLPGGAGAAGRGGQFAQLGVDAVIGARLWDMNARIEIVIGPLEIAAFRAFQPAGKHHDMLARLVRLFVDDEVDCVVRLGLRREDVPAAQIGAARLGADGWLEQGALRKADVYDVIFPVVSRPG